jgi:hypothetical protein
MMTDYWGTTQQYAQYCEYSTVQYLQVNSSMTLHKHNEIWLAPPLWKLRVSFTRKNVKETNAAAV